MDDEHGIEQDTRSCKPCFGYDCFDYACYYCRHAEACTAGETNLLYIPREEMRELVSENAAISSTLTAAVSKFPSRRADRVSIIQSLRPLTHEP